MPVTLIISESLLPLKKLIAILVNKLLIARTVQSNPSNANIETCGFFSFNLDHMAVLKHLVKQDSLLAAYFLFCLKAIKIVNSLVKQFLIK